MALTAVVENSFLKEEADLITTGDEIVSASLQDKMSHDLAEDDDYVLNGLLPFYRTFESNLAVSTEYTVGCEIFN